MATDKPPVWIFNASSPDKRGLLESFNSGSTISAETFISFSGVERLIRVVRGTGDDSKPWEDVPLTGATITIALGPLSVEPTGGNSYGQYNAVATGLTPLPAGATALQMQTLLNASPGIAGEGGVTVTKGKTGYRIEWVNAGGPRLNLEWFAGSLTPTPRVSTQTIVEGAAGIREVKLVKIWQDYWGGGDDWVEESDGDVTYTQATAGADGVKEVAKIVITGIPTSGQFRVTSPKPAVHTINASDNGQSACAYYQFDFNGNTIATGNFVDIADDAGPVRLWFNIAGGGGAPAAPAGGRLLEVVSGTILPGDLGQNLWSTVGADSGLAEGGAIFGWNVVSIRTRVLGVYPVPLTPGFVVLNFTQGSAGRLDGKYFTIYDAAGKVGVWFNLGGLKPIPTALDSASRLIEITGIAPQATANTVATAIKLALDTDAAFIATVVGAKVTVTDAVGGPRALPSNGNAYVGITQTAPGYVLSATLPYNASAAQMRDALQGLADVTRTETPTEIAYVLTYVETGAQAALTAADINLGFSSFYRGTFTLNTETMLAAFEDTSEDTLSGILQANYQYPGEDPVAFYYERVNVLRSLIDSGGVNPGSVFGTGTREGAQAVGVGNSFVDVVFDTALPSAEYKVICGYLENAVDAPPDAIMAATVCLKTSAGYRQLLSGAPATGNFVYKYIVSI